MTRRDICALGLSLRMRAGAPTIAGNDLIWRAERLFWRVAVRDTAAAILQAVWRERRDHAQRMMQKASAVRSGAGDNELSAIAEDAPSPHPNHPTEEEPAAAQHVPSVHHEEIRVETARRGSFLTRMLSGFGCSSTAPEDAIEPRPVPRSRQSGEEP